MIATIMITHIAKNSGADIPIVDHAVVILSASALRQTSTAQATAAPVKSRPKMMLRCTESGLAWASKGASPAMRPHGQNGRESGVRYD
jgi:hypothetical protein